jgi:hypothetical protein
LIFCILWTVELLSCELLVVWPGPPPDLCVSLMVWCVNRLTLEYCLSLTHEEVHITADTTDDFISLETSSLVTTKHVKIYTIKNNCQPKGLFNIRKDEWMIISSTLKRI